MTTSLTRAWSSGNPISINSTKNAAPGDLLDWLEVIGIALAPNSPHRRRDGEAPHYIVQSRERVRAELERRMAS